MLDKHLVTLNKYISSFKYMYILLGIMTRKTNDCYDQSS